MVRFGKLAEKALVSLDEKGSYDSRTPWMRRYNKHFNDFRVSRFPGVPVVTKERAGYSPLIRPQVGQVVEAEKPLHHPSFPIHAVLPVYSPNGWRKKSVLVGHLRLNTKLGTFFPSMPSLLRERGGEPKSQKSPSIRLLAKRHSWDKSVSLVCRLLSENAAGPSLSVDPLCSTFCRSMARWLAEDRVGEAFLDDLRSFASRHRDVERVMTA